MPDDLKNEPDWARLVESILLDITMLADYASEDYIIGITYVIDELRQAREAAVTHALKAGGVGP